MTDRHPEPLTTFEAFARLQAAVFRLGQTFAASVGHHSLAETLGARANEADERRWELRRKVTGE